MIKCLFVFSILLVWLRSCGSTDNSKQEKLPAQDSIVQQNPAPSPPLKPPPMTTIKPNLTQLGAQVDSVVLVDSVLYRIYVLVGSAFPVTGTENIVELNEHIVLEPQYTYREDGSYDTLDKRNERLFKLRSAVPKSVFIGKITLVPLHGLRIIDFDSY